MNDWEEWRAEQNRAYKEYRKSATEAWVALMPPEKLQSHVTEQLLKLAPMELPKPQELLPTEPLKPEDILPPPPPSPHEVPSRLKEIVAGTDHKNLLEAVLADIVDVIPIIGDISNVARIANTALDDKPEDKKYTKKRVIAQSIDAVGGVLPEPLSVVYDLLTPTNTLLFLSDKKPPFKIKKKAN